MLGILTGADMEVDMSLDGPQPRGFVGRFLGSWQLALGELVIVSLGVLIALWADQAMQNRQEAAAEVSYLERLRTDIQADLRALRFSSDQARNRLANTRQVDAWLQDPTLAPDPDSLVMNAHFAGVTFAPTISKFTIEELKSTGDLRLLRNDTLKRQIADYYNQISLQVEQWMMWGDEGVIETYFRELAFVLDPEPRIRAGTFDPALMRQFLAGSSGEAPSDYSAVQGVAPEIGATRSDADRMLDRMRSRPNFGGYLRDSMYWAHLKAQLLDGLVLSAEELESRIAAELESLAR